MPVIAPEIVSERGKADARRHRQKQKDAIRKQLPHIIAEESIITGKRDRIIKIPVKNLQIPEFKHRRSGKGKVGGLGQGAGGKGDVIGRRSAPGKQSGKDGKPGSEPGVDYIETEIEIAELIEFMFEDLGLPRLEEKQVRKIIVEAGWRVHGTVHTGSPVLRNNTKTAREGIKRFWFMLEMLCKETGREKVTCFYALKEADGIIPDALLLLENRAFTHPVGMTEEDIAPFPIIHPDDERYHRLEKKTAQKSQAVVFAMMDVSGSMTDDKKYYARSLLFWLSEFLRKIYEYVEIRFIIHHTIARIVPEEDFFRTGESGGTMCYTAYEMVNALIESDYPLSQWNVYAWHFSDGEDFSPARTVAELKKLFEKKINMFGYGEISPGANPYSTPELLEAFTKEFDLHKMTGGEELGVFVSVDENIPLIGVVIQKKEHILAALKAFLKRDRWQK